MQHGPRPGLQFEAAQASACRFGRDGGRIHHSMALQAAGAEALMLLHALKRLEHLLRSGLAQPAVVLGDLGTSQVCPA